MTIPSAIREERPTRDMRIERLLCKLQAEAETGTLDNRRRNRAMLRGFRAALWGASCKASVTELEEVLRHELGLPPTFQRQQPVPAGTSTEVDSHD